MSIPPPRGPRRPLTPVEARTVRRWLALVVALALFVMMLPPAADQRVQRLATMIVIATLAMGAITVRRPAGLRVMLGVAAALAFAYLCTSLGDGGSI